MTASPEALALLDLVSDDGRFSARVKELAAAEVAAEKAAEALHVAEKSTAEATATKLQVASTLLKSLQDQTSAIQEKNAAETAQIEAARNDVARREAELLELKQQHVDQVASALRDHERRSAELEQQRSTQDEDFHSRVEALRLVENKLRDCHRGLRDIVGQARQGIAAAS